MWNYNRWPNFRPHELLSLAGRAMLERGVFLLDVNAVDKLQKLRSILDAPVLCNYQGMVFRGYRSSEENAAINGAAPFSFHLQGKAFDVSCPRVPLEQLEKAAIDAGFSYSYRISEQSLHVDTRFLG